MRSFDKLFFSKRQYFFQWFKGGLQYFNIISLSIIPPLNIDEHYILSLTTYLT